MIHLMILIRPICTLAAVRRFAPPAPVSDAEARFSVSALGLRLQPAVHLIGLLRQGCSAEPSCKYLESWGRLQHLLSMVTISCVAGWKM